VRLLITGIHGFIGSSVGLFARGAGHEVLGVDLPAQPPAGWQGGYRQLDAAHADLAAPVREFAPDALVHAAGSASVGDSYQAPLDDLRAAVLTWANTLDGVRRSGLAPLVLFPSSAAVYGNPARLPVAEDAPLAPISPYGFHKAACELLAREYAECFGLDVLVARLFSVYGPRQRRLLLWELFARAAGAEPEIRLHGTGKETRDYLHVDDVAAALLHAATARPRGLTVLNVASGEAVATGDLARLVAGALGTTKPVRALGEVQTGNPVHWRADVTRLKALGADFHRPLGEGVRACVEAWR
jgi:UDP-glucose 4-epimerase